MKRKVFLTRLGIIGTPLVALGIVLGVLGSTAAAQGSGIFGARPISGPRANATVSFGQWQTSPALDRFPNVSPRTANTHEVLPNQVRIEKGGAVNFVIGGFHEPTVYGNGTQPTAINVNNIVPSTGTPAGVPLINDPANRVYRGLDPSLQTQDRVEVVRFDAPGTYLVICAVRPHFVNDGMYGFVRVVGPEEED
jgi:hypothetical protein